MLRLSVFIMKRHFGDVEFVLAYIMYDGCLCIFFPFCRTALRHLKLDRIKKFEYCLPCEFYVKYIAALYMNLMAVDHLSYSIQVGEFIFS